MKRNVLFFISVLFSISCNAQSLFYKFDEAGDTYIRGSFRGQFWARYIETNPGTAINGEPINHSFDVSIRRYRIGFQSQIKKKWFLFMLFGNNNLNQKTLRNNDFRLLDLSVEYTFSEKFTLGVGKIIFGGAGRFVQFSNGSMLNLDPAVHQLFTLNQYDDIGRNLGIFAKGQLGKIDYTFSLQSPTYHEGSKNSPRLHSSSYIKYEFLDNESNRNPYSGGVGTYIGTKKVLNIGFGYNYQPKMMYKEDKNEISFEDYTNFGIDLFVDLPISAKNEAITAYLGYNSIHYKENYVRNIAVNSIFDNAGTSFNGGGNAYPIMGTGNTLLFQFGYLFGKSEKNNVRFQPNFGWKYADFQGLNQSANSYSFGLNTYFNGHKSKLSFSYDSRPIFDVASKKVSDRKGMYIVQYQMEL